MDYSIDYHVHCGQFKDVYFQPAYVIQALHVNGIKKVWLSSTTSNMDWNNEQEKDLLIDHVEKELEEAMNTGNAFNMEIFPLYWVIPQRHIEGESIEDVMRGFPYRGFKIHPRMIGWKKYNTESQAILYEICKFADDNQMPILIHTGLDIEDSPDRYESLFSAFPAVRFYLAHCKKTDTIIRLFRQYKNLYGDCSFCLEESIRKIYKEGFFNRMCFGTDFPITYLFSTPNCDENVIAFEELQEHYNKLKKSVMNSF